MKVSELLTKLSYGELSGLSWTGEGDGTIADASRIQQMILLANESLLRLHSKFFLKESELMLEEQSFLTHYVLDKAHAYANPDRPELTPGYIMDTVNKPFQDDVIKIHRVSYSKSLEFPLNDSENPGSLFTPTPNVLQINNPVALRLLSVTYQARHPILTDVNSEIVLPVTLYGALTSYIAHQVFNHMNGQENSAKSAEHLSIYETICEQITEMDLVSSSAATSNVRFWRNGWR